MPANDASENILNVTLVVVAVKRPEAVLILNGATPPSAAEAVDRAARCWRNRIATTVGEDEFAG